MKAMLTGFAAIIVIGVAAWYGLQEIVEGPAGVGPDFDPRPILPRLPS